MGLIGHLQRVGITKEALGKEAEGTSAISLWPEVPQGNQRNHHVASSILTVLLIMFDVVGPECTDGGTENDCMCLVRRMQSVL